MPTTKIMLIRHAEKPNGDAGLMPDGTQNPEALTALGWTRANAGRPVRSREWSRPAAAPRQADESLRLGI
jgi:broad specificity phosphatase PhoE